MAKQINRKCIQGLLGVPVDQIERALVIAAMEKAENYKPDAAALLGVSLRTMYTKLEKMGLHDRQPRVC